MICQYLWSKAGFGFDQCDHLHFVLRRRERRGRRGERSWFQSHALRRDQNPERCMSQHPHAGLPNRATVYTPEAGGITNLQHYPSPNWVGARLGRDLFLRTEISGAGRKEEDANKAGCRQTELVEQAPRFSRKQILLSPHPSRSRWSLYRSNLRL